MHILHRQPAMSRKKQLPIIGGWPIARQIARGDASPIETYDPPAPEVPTIGAGRSWLSTFGPQRRALARAQAPRRPAPRLQ